MSELRQAIECIRAGDRTTGKRLLIEVLKKDPSNKNAWIWMTEVVDSIDDRIECLQKVLRLDPDDEIAKQGIARLQTLKGGKAALSKSPSRREEGGQQGSPQQSGWSGLSWVLVGLGILGVLGIVGLGIVFVPRLLSAVTPEALTAVPSVDVPTATNPRPSSIPTLSTATPFAALSPSPLPSTPTSTPQSISEPNIDGSKIIYVAQSGGYSDVYIRVINPDGSEPLVLGEFSSWDTRLLDWSRDASWLLLSNYSDGTFALRADASGHIVTLSSQAASFGAWSPMGDQAILVHDEGLSLVDLATGGERNIALPSAFQEAPEDEFSLGEYYTKVTGASWAPNGEWFAFQTIDVDSAREFAVGHLYRYDVAADSLTELMSNPRAVFYRIYLDRDHPLYALPVVSPDGETILTDLFSTPNLSLVSAAGGSPTVWLNSALPAVEPPRWSQNGEWLAIAYKQDIYLISRDGAQVRNLSQTPTLVEQHLSWSPDGRYLVCAVETIIGGQDIAVYDIQTGQQSRLTADTGKWGGANDTSPLWSPVLSAEHLQSLAKAEPVLPPPTFEPSPGGVSLPTPEKPDPSLTLEPPPMAMDPPWWNTRYFYRRPLRVSSAVPIVYDADELGYPPMVQMAFDPTVIRDQLQYPVYGYDVHVAWWDEKEQSWTQLPCDVDGLDTEQALLVFPLQESLAGDSDAYYLYYGSPALLQRGEEAESLMWPRYPVVGDTVQFTWRSMYFFTPGEYSEAETEVTWVSGPNRLVAEISALETVPLSAYLLNEGQGTLSLSFRPADADEPGVLLSIARQEIYALAGSREVIVEPLLTYDGSALHFLVGGGDFVTPVAWEQNRWYNITLTWTAGGRVALFVDGVEVSAASYEPVIPSDRDMSYHNLQLGATETDPGWAGQYYNLDILSQPLTSAEVLRFYQAQRYTTVTLGDTETPAVTTSLITPEDGGRLRSPDGKTWVEFPPGAVDEPTTVSFAAINPGETQEHHLTRFELLPFAWNPTYDGMTREEYEALISTPLPVPFTVFYRYDPEYVEAPYSITCFWYDPSPDVQNWVGYLPSLDETVAIAVCPEVNHWGSYTIAKDYGLGGPPQIRP